MNELIRYRIQDNRHFFVAQISQKYRESEGIQSLIKRLRLWICSIHNNKDLLI